MKLEIKGSTEELGAAAATAGAGIIRDAIARKGASTIVVATGMSQLNMLDHLVKAEGIDWSKVTAFHLDEYVGIPESHPASFRRYLKKRFVARLPALNAFVPVEGDARDLDGEIKRLNAALEGLDVDVCFAGIGENCHLAFNDPPADFCTDDPYLVVELDEACRRQQLGEGWFPSLADVPLRAISMSVRQMMKARTLIVSVPDLRKAKAVKAAVEAEVSPQFPASILQRHASCTLFLDTLAASLLTEMEKRVRKSRWLETPGLFDLQVNGFAGIDFNDEAITPEMLDFALNWMRSTGVTLCLPTLITAPSDTLDARFKALDRAVMTGLLGPGMCPGYHLEGPFLNPAEGYRGCHPHQAMTAADPALVERLEAGLGRPILLITLAPEVEGALELIRWAKARGKVVAMGHSAAKGEVLAEAVEAGLSLSTHLGNGVPQSVHKLDNTIFAQLAEDRLFADFIADGIHIPPHALKVLLRAKGVERSILVTDAVSAAAASVGTHPFAGFTVERDADGKVHLPGQPLLAGSSLTLDAAVRNVVSWGFASFEEAIAMASANPHRLMAEALAAHGITVFKGRATWSEAIEVESTELYLS